MQLPSVTVPGRIRNYDSFRLWARSPECPEKTRLLYHRGALWLDLSLEELYTHNQVKSEICSVLLSSGNAGAKGRYAMQGMLLSMPAVELSCTPDGFFFSFDALRSGRMRGVGDTSQDWVEMEGVPEMTLEIVSDSTEVKDLVLLREWYWRAGVEEYWLIDARPKVPNFQILRHHDGGYRETVQDSDGWVVSEAFKRTFRLVRDTDRRGKPDCRLEAS